MLLKRLEYMRNVPISSGGLRGSLSLLIFLIRSIAQPLDERAFLQGRTRAGWIETGSELYCGCSSDGNSCSNDG